mmetsp:Transcript_12513/g.33479  ORF Transcript_12513/g.33479 Transcript_12513/m.33479 type:complete len:284 (-) Transcript_12513:176-1027(-)
MVHDDGAGMKSAVGAEEDLARGGWVGGTLAFHVTEELRDVHDGDFLARCGHARAHGALCLLQLGPRLPQAIGRPRLPHGGIRCAAAAWSPLCVGLLPPRRLVELGHGNMGPGLVHLHLEELVVVSELRFCWLANHLSAKAVGKDVVEALVGEVLPHHPRGGMVESARAQDVHEAPRVGAHRVRHQGWQDLVVLKGVNLGWHLGQEPPAKVVALGRVAGELEVAVAQLAGRGLHGPRNVVHGEELALGGGDDAREQLAELVVTGRATAHQLVRGLSALTAFLLG